jgi:simple sugar transport system substrate-binding protein
MHISKRGFRGLVTIAATGALAGLSACSGGADAGSTGDAAGSDVITVGFVAVGPEGGWRNANEQAIKDAFTKDAGFDLKYAPRPARATRSRSSTPSRPSSTTRSTSSC